MKVIRPRDTRGKQITEPLVLTIQIGNADAVSNLYRVMSRNSEQGWNEADVIEGVLIEWKPLSERNSPPRAAGEEE